MELNKLETWSVGVKSQMTLPTVPSIRLFLRQLAIRICFRNLDPRLSFPSCIC